MRIKAFYYIKRFGYNALPDVYFKRKYQGLLAFEKDCDPNEFNNRLNYYFKLGQEFKLPETAISIKNFKRTRGTDYYLDLKEFLHFFSPETSFAYRFGDDTDVNSFPTLVKARPINGENANSILFKLNKNRHFNWVNDSRSFKQKKDLLVWRGGAYKKLRRSFVEQYWNHPLCNVKQTNKPEENVPWQGDFLSIAEQLKYKFICCPEGNDVATNLKWVMSSNSLCIMPKPQYETWFMEGVLKPGIHYVEVQSDFSDLEEKILYYSQHVDEAVKIISNAHQHVERFKNPDLEDLLCLKVLELYATKSNQQNILKFA